MRTLRGEIIIPVAEFDALSLERDNEKARADAAEARIEVLLNAVEDHITMNGKLERKLAEYKRLRGFDIDEKIAAQDALTETQAVVRQVTELLDIYKARVEYDSRHPDEYTAIAYGELIRDLARALLPEVTP